MSIKEAPGGSRVERKKEETKKKIIAVAMKLFGERSFDGTTMEQIAREVDIAKGTLYNYFPAKEAIIDEYIKRSFREKNSERILQLQKMPDTRSRMILIFSELMKGMQAHKDFFEKYIVYRMQNMVSFHVDESEKSGLYLLAIKIIELGQESAEIRDDLPLYVLEDLFEFAFIEVVKQFYMEREKFKVRDAIEQCVDLFMNGVKRET
ncbi:MAG: helix-turn-helix domain containing protein [Clostridia bacterium]|nr:helix-turn-helix domain containing protein [Clostridia bacterium]